MPLCNICKVPANIQALEKFTLTMSECSRCGLVFTDEVPQGSEARYNIEWFEKEYLPSFGIDPQSPSTGHLNDRFDQDLKFIEKHVTRPGRMLDVGAGAGLFLNRAKQRGWEVFGVEPAPYGVEYAKKHFGIQMFQGVLQDADISPKSFDAVILQDVVEHVTDPQELMIHAQKLLRPGGIVFLSTPNYGSLSRRLFRSNWSLISPAGHVSLFRPRTMREMLRNAKLNSGFVNK